MQRMKRVRNALEATAHKAGNAGSDPICIAWYRDRGKELLDMKTLDMLIRHEEWRVQLLALQSYIKPKEIHHGEYHRSTEEIPDKAVPTRKSTIDALTKSMSQYSETAYANMKGISELEDPVLCTFVFVKFRSLICCKGH